MLNNVIASIVPAVVLIACSTLQADSPDPATEAIRNAIRKSIPLLEKGSAGSAKHRKCFTCHNQGLPVLALVEARRRGFTIDEDNLQLQLRHTAASLGRRKTKLLEGRGKTIIEGYALWTLAAGGWKPDETTAAAAGFLLENQKRADHWRNPGNRPPSVGSDFTTSYVALRGLAAFGTEQQQSKIEARKKAVRQWLLGATPRDSEDRVFRLRALGYVDADEQTVRKATAELIDAQRSDGGWSQKSDMKSDAYATGSVLAALMQAGNVRADHSAVRRGVRYLVETQLKDGSWHVVTRAKAFQTYFESGFPHGKDQFISIAASGWATLALLLASPQRKRSAADSRGQDKYQEYARWWKKKTEAKPGLVKRDENGKRLGRVFTVPTDPKSVGAEEAERTGIVQGPTFVLGVAIGQHARAYPIHALGFELLNDTLGDVAIAASW